MKLFKSEFPCHVCGTQMTMLAQADHPPRDEDYVCINDPGKGCRGVMYYENRFWPEDRASGLS